MKNKAIFLVAVCVLFATAYSVRAGMISLGDYVSGSSSTVLEFTGGSVSAIPDASAALEFDSATDKFTLVNNGSTSALVAIFFGKLDPGGPGIPLGASDTFASLSFDVQGLGAGSSIAAIFLAVRTVNDNAWTNFQVLDTLAPPVGGTIELTPSTNGLIPPGSNGTLGQFMTDKNPMLGVGVMLLINPLGTDGEISFENVQLNFADQAVVPEPATIIVLSAGMAAFALRRRSANRGKERHSGVLTVMRDY